MKCRIENERQLYVTSKCLRKLKASLQAYDYEVMEKTVGPELAKACYVAMETVIKELETEVSSYIERNYNGS